MARESDESNDRVLDVSELDITEDERVHELEDGRFVISTDGPPNVTDVDTDSTDAETNASAAAGGDVEDAPVESGRKRFATELSSADPTYVVEGRAVVGGSASQTRVETSDVVDGFDHLVEWYAEAVGPGTPPSETLGILVAESETVVSYSAAALSALAEKHDLGPEDSIDELVDACRTNDDVESDVDSHV